MSFLDNLENSLKSLEGREENTPSREDVERRRAQSLATGPWAERLRSSEYTKRLLELTPIIGHRLRAKVYLAWLDGALRMEVKGRSCQLTPTADGIEAKYQELEEGTERQEMVNLDSDNPAALFQHWLKVDA